MPIRRTLCAALMALALVATARGQQTQTPVPALPPLDMSGPDVERLKAYHERIVEAVPKLPARPSVADLLKPVLLLAEQRSVTGLAAVENRAAILAVAFYVNGRSLALVVPQARDWPRAANRGLTMAGRGDLAQHFTVSAAVSAAAGAALADFIGLYKEIDDARRGSGFSFADLAADRAGTRLGLLATASEESARRLQARLRAGAVEGDMMPDISGLPEGIPQHEFARRYQGEQTAAYDELVQTIERRLSALALFQ